MISKVKPRTHGATLYIEKVFRRTGNLERLTDVLAESDEYW
jgi:hypothetical protein